MKGCYIVAFTRTMKLNELEGIINKHCTVSIREAGTSGKDEDFHIPFSLALQKYGEYTVWFIDPESETTLDIIVSEDEP